MFKLKKLFSAALAVVIALSMICGFAASTASPADIDRSNYEGVEPTIVEPELVEPAAPEVTDQLRSADPELFAVNKDIFVGVRTDGEFVRVFEDSNWWDNRVSVTIDNIQNSGTVTVRVVDLATGGSAQSSLAQGQGTSFNITPGEGFVVYMSADVPTNVNANIRTYSV